MKQCQVPHAVKINKAQADFIGCLFTGLIAALPCFLEAFLACLSGTGPGSGDDDYDPGTRNRCD